MKRASVKIGDLGRVVTGKTPPTKQREFFDGDYPFITPSDLEYDSYHVTRTETTVTEDAKAKFPNQFVPAGAITYTCIASVGKIGIAERESLTNQQINSVIPGENHDGTFVYYLLRNETKQIQGRCGGVATPIVNKSDFERIEVNVPAELAVERAIGTILSAYDDLIENNRRRMALLEEAAQQIYREWFVRLRFPGHEHTRITNGVPEGWERDKVANLLANIEAKPRVPKEAYLPSGPIPCVDQSADFIGGFTDDEEAVYSAPLPLIVFGDHTRILKFVNFEFARGADGTQVIYPNTERISTEYLYFALKEIDLSNYFYARHYKFLKDKEVLLPGETLVREFTLFAKPVFDQVQSLRSQNEKLRAARDLLLPRLMSGEIAV